jgi:hypothetical protein
VPQATGERDLCHDLDRSNHRLSQNADALEADLRRLKDALGTKNETDGFPILALWNAADDVHQRRALLESVLSRIDVEQGAATLHFRYGIRDPYRIRFNTHSRRSPESTLKELRFLGFGRTDSRSIVRDSGSPGASGTRGRV